MIVPKFNTIIILIYYPNQKYYDKFIIIKEQNLGSLLASYYKMNHHFLNRYILKLNQPPLSVDGVRTHEATDSKTGKDVYLKTMNRNESLLSNFVNDPKLRQKMEKLKASQYFSVVYEVSLQETITWASIERGQTNLQKFGNKKNGFTFNQIFSNLLDITTACCCLKSIGVVHCNLTHSLVQFRASNQNLFISGLDFCIQQSKLPYPSLKYKLNLLSDFRFLAPQLLYHNSQITEKCTVWNIGVIFYWMLYQKWPYDASTRQQFMKELQKPLKVPSADVKSYNPIFNSLLKGCLNLNKQQRFGVIQLLEGVLKLANINQRCHTIIKNKQKRIIFAIEKLACYPTIFKSIGDQKIIDDNINYIYFLDKFCCLLPKIQVQIKQVPMLSLTNYIIRCRLEHLRIHRYWHTTHSVNYDSLSEQFEQLNQKYSRSMSSELMNKLNNQKYITFQNKFYGHRQIVYLHYQAFLREFIVRVVRKIFRKMQNQTEFRNIQYSVHMLNDALFIFNINGRLIQSTQNCKWEFFSAGELEKTLNLGFSDDPHKLFKDNVHKILALDILEDEGFQKEIRQCLAFEEGPIDLRY